MQEQCENEEDKVMTMYYSIPCLMSVLASDCTGQPIRDLSVESPMLAIWNSGAFSTVSLCGCGKQPLQFSISKVLDAKLQFEVACMKPKDRDVSKVDVNLHLHDSYGDLQTTISVACSQDICDAIDFNRISQIGYGLHERQHPRMTPSSVEHVVYEDEFVGGYHKTLVEDIPLCREIVSRLCRELTAQLSAHGYWLRPVDNNDQETARP
jgi:hypothetical protein